MVITERCSPGVWSGTYETRARGAAQKSKGNLVLTLGLHICVQHAQLKEASRVLLRGSLADSIFSPSVFLFSSEGIECRGEGISSLYTFPQRILLVLMISPKSTMVLSGLCVKLCTKYYFCHRRKIFLVVHVCLSLLLASAALILYNPTPPAHSPTHSQRRVTELPFVLCLVLIQKSHSAIELQLFNKCVPFPVSCIPRHDDCVKLKTWKGLVPYLCLQSFLSFIVSIRCVISHITPLFINSYH